MILKKLVAKYIGYRRSADMKRWLVRILPSPVLKVINKYLINLVPREIYQSSVVFVHVPKVAGTTISRALYKKSIGHQMAGFIYKTDPSLRTSKISISLVRDPMDRLYSAYRFLKSGGTNDVEVECADFYSGSDFNDFSSFVKNWLKPNFNNIYKYDYALWPQSWFILDDSGNKIVDRVYAIEDIDELEQYLKNNNHISDDIVSYNVTTQKKMENYLCQEEKEEIELIVKGLYADDYNLYLLAREKKLLISDYEMRLQR
ncbi:MULTISPECIES: sulfotransferase family 2 domain-containing protein [unclassified Oceanobacter]|uniref:sulfotransferase family 2 domain-containing protein n=1 Tax=unclassified Oceanobacter TaxID=2620260 RepID=UPI0026E260F5|nr:MULTISPECIES: sulfotransferase family 2 domain-containing protein [unclassified Oceanobacter]MDO6681330.1 sulfotransferase family 2 domain-containing protein [Oceanobacter sp. 5_MG-2023]MDP2505041.1 sulfotransferase family 2 domain-containing protein [Oceanobacter sp. 3_MG-2023]